MKKFYILGFLGLIIVLDEMLPRIADRQIRSSGIFEKSISTLMPSLDELNPGSETVCELHRIYFLYLFQICFKPYTANEDKNMYGYHLVYHRPKPRLTLIMPANGPDSYYFQETAQGEFLLFVWRNGRIQYGDGR